jgi:hypothetical protein
MTGFRLQALGSRLRELKAQDLRLRPAGLGLQIQV